MDLDPIKVFLLWCAGIHYAILLAWFAVFVLRHDALHRLHGRWFRLPVETFDALNYAGVAIYKIGILLFVVVPLLALIILDGWP
jgi:hypothetical protein